MKSKVYYSKSAKKGGLGRGMASILGGSKRPTNDQTEPEGAEGMVAGRYLEVDIHLIFPKSTQPRTSFSEQKIAELAQSIKKDGLLQPIVVTEEWPGQRYEVIAGESRLKAAKIAGITKIPVVVKEVSDHDAFRLALVENIQRSDLNAIEVALAYKKIIDDTGMSQQECAQLVGKDRTTVTGALRLLNLPDTIRQDIENKRLTAGHGVAILMVPTETEQLEAAEAIKAGGLSVRAAEQLCRDIAEQLKVLSSPEEISKSLEELKKDMAKPDKEEEEALNQFAEQVGDSLEAKAKIVGSKRRGKIVVHYHSPGELKRLLRVMGVS
ncbi:MAG: ParB/RepB/Spo0J family partition protein [Proteobacteria bacterium]|nr:ParB/RepB/Spo0J family partition protein [Pseudomonadota bacterium]